MSENIEAQSALVPVVIEEAKAEISTNRLPNNIIQFQFLLLALRSMGECLVDASDLALMGPERFGQGIKRGSIAVGLEKAAYMIRFGTMDGYSPNASEPPAGYQTLQQDGSPQSWAQRSQS